MPLLRNPRHEAFAQNLAKGMSAAAAYRKAGYKPNRSHAARMVTKGNIRARVRELMTPAIEAVELSVERVLREMTRLAFYDMTQILNVKDDRITMHDPTMLPEDLRRAITGIKPTTINGEVYYECKFADKQKALDSLARHLQMFKDTLIVENVFKVVMEMDDDELDRRLRELELAIAGQTTLNPSPGTSPANLH